MEMLTQATDCSIWLKTYRLKRDSTPAALDTARGFCAQVQETIPLQQKIFFFEYVLVGVRS
jgi:hypothetical protein